MYDASRTRQFRCYYCRKPGHRRDVCPKLNNQSSNNSNSSSGKPNQRYKKANANYAMDGDSNGIVFVADDNDFALQCGTKTTMRFIIDSGASEQMANDEAHNCGIWPIRSPLVLRKMVHQSQQRNVVRSWESLAALESSASVRSQMSCSSKITNTICCP